MENKKIIKKEYNKTIHLHGREEILDFFKDEYKDNKEELEEFVDSILENPEGTCIGFPYEMEDESNRYLEERKIVGIIVHHNADIKFSVN
ncbi:hypothetical protein NXY30_12695 [Bacteroides faecis]|uniref:Uncharacterized protein n=1 Tax=Bacteroides faecis TaxID=674529 RepID=A0ABY5THD6_9BACE|nr:hypothetical protein [Bacteroides faecis]UVQ77165.1 hypothetical protein NXY30_12695 [Bacteroides faecis]